MWQWNESAREGLRARRVRIPGGIPHVDAGDGSRKSKTVKNKAFSSALSVAFPWCARYWPLALLTQYQPHR